MIICRVMTRGKGLVMRENKLLKPLLTPEDQKKLSDAHHLIYEVWSGAKARHDAEVNQEIEKLQTQLEKRMEEIA